MHTALTWLMTSQPPADSGDRSTTDRRFGYVNFSDVVAAIKLANAPLVGQVAQLERTLRNEFQAQTKALADQLERHEEEADTRDRRIAALEQWQRGQEIDDAFRRGFWHVVMLAFRWTAEHWQFALVVCGTIFGIVWVIVAGGRPGVTVTP